MKHLTLFFTLLLTFTCFSPPAFALPHPYFSKHPQAAKKLEQLLSQAQLQALEFQPADLSLELKDLEGNNYSLRQHRGQVLMLTRWATWCGACKSEMPFKVKLHNSIQDKRFTLIGISDESRDTVADFQKNAASPYPVSLLDSQGLMTKFFPGGAIPVTIIVDGWGWLIAMKRGGAPWNQPVYEKLVRYLLSLAPTQEQLKEKAPAPTVSFPTEVTVTAGQTFALVFSLNWVGESDKYARIAFRLPKEKGLQRLGVQTMGIHSTQTGNQRKYALRMKAVKAGTYKLDPVLLNYWIKDYDQHFQVKAGALTIQVKTASALSSPRQAWPLYAIGAAVLLLFVMGLMIRRQKQADTPPSEEDLAQQQRQQKLVALLSNLRDAHHGTDPKAQIESLYQIYKEILEEVPANVSSLRDDIRYGGHDLTTDQRRQLLAQLADDLHPTYPDEAKEIRSM